MMSPRLSEAEAAGTVFVTDTEMLVVEAAARG